MSASTGQTSVRRSAFTRVLLPCLNSPTTATGTSSATSLARERARRSSRCGRSASRARVRTRSMSARVRATEALATARRVTVRGSQPTPHEYPPRPPAPPASPSVTASTPWRQDPPAGVSMTSGRAGLSCCLQTRGAATSTVAVFVPGPRSVRMKGKSPLLTLLVGLATAIVLIALSMHATSEEAARQKARATPATPPAPTSAAAPSTAPAAPPTTAAPADQSRATYAGRVNGAAATIAIAVRDGSAIAYVCDGRQAEAWLQGTASAGQLTMTGSDGASLSGNYDGGKAAGSVAATGKQWAFEVPVAVPPSGLYRAAANVANAKIVGGWIVLADGTQVGVLNTAGTPAPAPPINTSTGGTVVNGTQVTATPINGTTGSGF